MEILIEALERIMNWLRKHQPEYADSFLPGLTSSEIQAVEAEFGYKLPEEIYTLYQWRNGTEKSAKAVCFPPPLEILPLSAAIEYSKGCTEHILEDKNVLEESKWYETSPLFVFIQSNCDFCGIPLVEDCKGKLPVVDLGEGYGPDILYTSLTDMMLTLAECYETNVYYLGEDGYIEEDECKTAGVLRKYNNELNEQAISGFKSILSNPIDFLNLDYANSDFRKLSDKINDFASIIERFKDPEGVDLLLEAFQTWSQAKGRYISRNIVCSCVIRALGETCDDRALQLLTNLQNNSPSFREEAQAALLRFRLMRRNM